MVQMSQKRIFHHLIDWFHDKYRKIINCNDDGQGGVGFDIFQMEKFITQSEHYISMENERHFLYEKIFSSRFP